jgi:hemerythrin-like domain-containing protein
MTTIDTAPANAATTPDVTMRLLMHRSMRTDAVRFVAAAERLDASDRAQAARLGRWFAGYREAIHLHHTTEDDWVFPALAERVGATGFPQVDQLAADHARLDDLLGAVGAGLATLAARSRLREATHLELTAGAVELEALLDRHLDLEEQEVVPVFVESFTAAEFGEIEASAGRSHGLRQLTFAAPWVVDHADDAERAALFDAAPLPVRVLVRLMRPRYERLASAL